MRENTQLRTNEHPKMKQRQALETPQAEEKKLALEKIKSKIVPCIRRLRPRPQPRPRLQPVRKRKKKKKTHV